jgi:hypothetical protein
MNIKREEEKKKKKKAVGQNRKVSLNRAEVYNSIYSEHNLVSSIYVSKDGITYAHM